MTPIRRTINVRVEPEVDRRRSAKINHGLILHRNFGLHFGDDRSTVTDLTSDGLPAFRSRNVDRLDPDVKNLSASRLHHRPITLPSAVQSTEMSRRSSLRPSPPDVLSSMSSDGGQSQICQQSLIISGHWPHWRCFTLSRSHRVDGRSSFNCEYTN